MPENPSEIRLAQHEDIPALQKFIAGSVRGLSTGYYTRSQIESAIKYIFGIDTQLVIDKTYFIAERDGILVGCGGWSKRNTPYGGDQHKAIEDPLLDPEKDSARIRAFFVHPAYVRQGIGRQIITLCESTAKGHGFKGMMLGATLPGVPLYEAAGYKAVRRVEVALPDGETLAIVEMTKLI